MRIKTGKQLFEVDSIRQEGSALYAHRSGINGFRIAYSSMFEALTAYEELAKSGYLDASKQECLDLVDDKIV